MRLAIGGKATAARLQAAEITKTASRSRKPRRISAFVATKLAIQGGLVYSAPVRVDTLGGNADEAVRRFKSRKAAQMPPAGLSRQLER